VVAVARATALETYTDVTVVTLVLKGGKKVVLVNAKVETSETFVTVRREEYSPELRATVATAITVPRESVEAVITTTHRVTIEQAEEIIAKYKLIEERTLAELAED
jgi:hypothetical protein